MRQTFKKMLVIFSMLLAGVLSVHAEELQEVVYLKNGSVIRGVILELVPDSSVKIQTQDGNIFVYNMSEVEKITKEAKTDPEPYGYQITPRYRGSVSLYMGGGLTDYDVSFMASTSHGVQLTPEFFAGGGFGIASYGGYNGCAIPFFINGRAEIHNILKRNVSPYGDVKLGYSAGRIHGVFFSPEMGCHFFFGHKKCGIGVGLAYILQEYYGDVMSGLSVGVTFNF